MSPPPHRQQEPPQELPPEIPLVRRKKPIRGDGDIDWYIVSIDTIKKVIVGLVALIVLGVGGAYYYFAVLHMPIDKRVSQAIGEAEARLNRVAGLSNLSDFKTEFGQARERLAEAQELLGDKKYESALKAALDSQGISKRILGTDTNSVGDAMIVDFEGSVEVQHQSSRFETAKLYKPLFVGDWIRTEKNGSADLMFTRDQSFLTVRPLSLVEVKLTQDPKTKLERPTVKMSKGIIMLNSGADPTIIETPESTSQVDPESIVQFDVDPVKRASSITVHRGGTRVRIGTVEQTLRPQERVKIDGDKIAKSKIPLPPALLEPPSERIYGLEDAKIKFAWSAVPNAKAYHLQISRSHIFVNNPVDLPSHRKTSLKVELTEDGAYYWRVATVNSSGNSDFSAYRRLKVASRPVPGASGTPPAPPRLRAAVSTHIGNTIFVIGETDAGVNIMVNEEITHVKTDGSFVKIVTIRKEGKQDILVRATSPAGAETVKRLKVFIKAEF